MNPLSKLILEHTSDNMKVDIDQLWTSIWKLGYSRAMIEQQCIKLGLLEQPKFKETLIGFPATYCIINK